MSSLYREMYNEDVCLTCPGNIEYAFEKMFRDREKIFPTIKMKRGHLIDTTMREEDHIPKGQFTINNITDDIAVILINNGYASHFL